MSVYVFLGPTLPVTEARRILDATYLPPVEQGDILRLLADRPRAIGIIDGRFQFVPSVWHKEILAALAQGVHVFGAASMGALRAAELWSFGMAGVGEVFEQYRDGVLEDDDEVAVTHATAEQGFREMSDAMVNIRDACAAAAGVGEIPEETADALVAIAKTLYFAERTWARVFEIARDCGAASADAVAVVNRIRRTRTPLKRRDAVALLGHMADFLRQDPAPFRPAFELERTVFLESLESEVRVSVAAGRFEVPNDGLQVARKKVLLELLATEEARRLGCAVTEPDVAAMAEWFRGKFDLERDFEQWKRETNLDDGTFSEVMRRFAAVARVQHHYRAAIESALGGHLAVTTARGRAAGWSQWNVALSRAHGAARRSAAAFFARLAPAIEALRNDGALERFYFVRKPPDIRLRFCGDGERISSLLAEVADASRKAGDIERWFTSVYEPETSRFGGLRALDLVHAYFDADTRAWLAWPDAPREYSAATLEDLFVSTLGSAEEAAQVWRQFIEKDEAAATARHPLWTAPLCIEHASANAALAQGLNALWNQGALERGIRAVLGSVGQFHCNRYGIAGPDQAALARAALDHYHSAQFLRQRA